MNDGDRHTLDVFDDVDCICMQFQHENHHQPHPVDETNVMAVRNPSGRHPDMFPAQLLALCETDRLLVPGQRLTSTHGSSKKLLEVRPTLLKCRHVAFWQSSPSDPMQARDIHKVHLVLA